MSMDTHTSFFQLYWCFCTWMLGHFTLITYCILHGCTKQSTSTTIGEFIILYINFWPACNVIRLHPGWIILKNVFSLSLSLSHTHTHTHTQVPFTVCLLLHCYEPVWTRVLWQHLHGPSIPVSSPCCSLHCQPSLCLLFWACRSLGNQDDINISMATWHYVPWWPS